MFVTYKDRPIGATQYLWRVIQVKHTHQALHHFNTSNVLHSTSHIYHILLSRKLSIHLLLIRLYSSALNDLFDVLF